MRKGRRFRAVVARVRAKQIGRRHFAGKGEAPMTHEKASKVARDLANSLGVRMHIVKLTSEDYLVLQRAFSDIVEIIDPPRHEPASHGRFTIAAAARP